MSQPAAAERRWKVTVAAGMATHNKTISASDAPGKRGPKNGPDRPAFSSNWTMKQASGTLASVIPSRRHTSHAATAIAARKTVRTGPNIQPGGVHGAWRWPGTSGPGSPDSWPCRPLFGIAVPAEVIPLASVAGHFDSDSTVRFW